MKRWFLYILECRGGAYYTGITTDVVRRIDQHNLGRGSRFTRGRIPVKLCYQEACRNRSEALKREIIVKALSKKRKEKLIKQNFIFS
ncbi:MAG: GIY-YIG nuclease family protein [Nitrospirae bacterium]|nr:GIY-YIG nuclease family protein [Nitrospirota bacterium]MBI3352071.1 GIY-YIG nuclease family protein [Nitrospirota bacterium]